MRLFVPIGWMLMGGALLGELCSRTVKYLRLEVHPLSITWIPSLPSELPNVRYRPSLRNDNLSGTRTIAAKRKFHLS